MKQLDVEWFYKDEGDFIKFDDEKCIVIELNYQNYL